MYIYILTVPTCWTRSLRGSGESWATPRLWRTSTYAAAATAGAAAAEVLRAVRAADGRGALLSAVRRLAASITGLR